MLHFISTWFYGAGVLVAQGDGADGVPWYLVSFPGFGRLFVHPSDIRGEELINLN